MGFAIAIAAVLVVFSGLFSGLNLGLMSFTEADLQVIIDGSPDPNEVKYAKRILPIRQRGNLLLCTLLLGNTLVNALIAVLLADLTSGIVGTMVTTGLIVVFGEIIPQSICCRHGLYIGAKSVPIVIFFIFLCGLVAFPISVLLDKLLGQEMGAMYTKQEFLALIRLNAHDPVRAKEMGMVPEEAKLIEGALTYQEQPVHKVMTALEDVFAIDMDAVLDKDTFQQIIKSSNSRVPVYEGRKGNVTSVLYLKDILGLGFERKTPVREVVESFSAESRILRIPRSGTSGEAFRLCKDKRLHMLIVVADPPAAGELPGDFTAPFDDNAGDALGVVTMEDILEEILQDEIVDEHDHCVHNRTRSSNHQRGDPLRLLARMQTGIGPLRPVKEGKEETGRRSPESGTGALPGTPLVVS